MAGRIRFGQSPGTVPVIANPMNTVLAAIDFSPVSTAVLAKASELARAIGGSIVILHAVQPPMIISDLAPVVGDTLQFTAGLERTARRHLQRVAQRLSKSGRTVETICEQGFPIPLILTQAKDQEARYIVLGSHGHTAFYDLVAGSTASGVIKRATCPVVVVPATATKQRAPRAARRSKARARTP
jgi:universal stress protein A